MEKADSFVSQELNTLTYVHLHTHTHARTYTLDTLHYITLHYIRRQCVYIYVNLNAWAVNTPN